MKTGQKIAHLRQVSGITQLELAERLYVSQQQVSNWENGNRRPDKRTLERISDIFGVSSDDIFSPDESVLKELEQCVIQTADVSEAELKKLINLFIETLSEKERYIFIHRYYHCEETYIIAETVGVRENQIRSILSRVRKKLKKYLEEVLS